MNLLTSILVSIILTLSSVISFSQPCGNDYGNSSDEADIIYQMRYGTISDVIAAINNAKNTRGNSLGCPQEIINYVSADFTEPTLTEIENIWNTIHKPAIEAILIDCPRIARYESNAVLGAYYANLAGYSISLNLLAQVGEMMTAQQYTSSTVSSVIAEHEGIFAYIHVGSGHPCYPGGVVGSSVEDVCSNAPSLCITYDFGLFNAEEFLIADQYPALDFYDGGAAYDHGWAGVHMIEAAIQQDDSVLKSKFKNASVLAGKWAINEYPVKNHNYTAKLIWLLAELYLWSGETIYKDALNEKLDRNLLPGILYDQTNDGFVDGTSPAISFSSLVSIAQTPGRMWDGHNSLPWYNAMNAWALTEAYVAFRDRGDNTRAAELKPYLVAMLDNLALEISSLGVIDPAYLGVRDLAYAFLIGVWKVAMYENEDHPQWKNALWAIWNSGAFDTYNTNSVCVGLYLLIKTNTPYVPLHVREDFNSIPNLSFNGAMEIYPNPASSIIDIKLSNPFNNEIAIKIYDSQGKLVKEQKSYSYITSLDISHLTAGTYTVKAFFEDETRTTKFVKL
ncbi:MAG: T9SS type A sorting domain-containing protein [Crocinitomicaceae bacterium]|nr:T9SS type A sorting domain-containing protein [Crocinitomicaceae bacterium]